VDTAPDMVAVLLAMRQDRNLAPLPYDLVRSHVSNGAAGLIRLGFPDVDGAAAGALKDEYLQRYAAAVCVDSTLFPGLAELLDEFDAGGLPWGVVTNKPERLTGAVLSGLGLAARIACAVCGDTIPERKPHPAPLLLASREIGVPAANTVYVGDASRDIEAGRAAGMATVAVAYGYIPAGEDPGSWGADEVVRDPGELAHYLRKGVTLAS